MFSALFNYKNMKKSAILFNCVSFVNYCEPAKKNSLNDQAYNDLLNNNPELVVFNAGVRGTIIKLNMEKFGWQFYNNPNQITTFSLLNEQFYKPYYNYWATSSVDDSNGVHYYVAKKANNNKYLFFFHGIMSNMNDFSDFCGDIKDNYLETFKDLDYNIVLIEYNSIVDKKLYESTKERIKNDTTIKDKDKDLELLFASKEYEVLYGLDQVNDMSVLLSNTIKNFLEGKNIDELVICGHSHGNNYGLEVLKNLVKDKFNTDKLVYLGCKGYLDIEETIAVAASGYFQTMKGYQYFDNNEKNIYAKVFKLLGDKNKYNKKGKMLNPSDPEYSKGKELGFVDKIIFILKELPISVLLKLFHILFYEYYDIILEQNNNENRLISMLDNLDIKNFKLSKEGHSIRKEDFDDMIKAYGDYKSTKSGDKIPCLLFYADKDPFVSNAFKKNITKISTKRTTDEIITSLTAKSKVDDENLKVDASLKKVIDKYIKDAEESKKEIEKEIKEQKKDDTFNLDDALSKVDIKKGGRSYVLNLQNTNSDKERIRDERNKNQDKPEETHEDVKLEDKSKCKCGKCSGK